MDDALPRRVRSLLPPTACGGYGGSGRDGGCSEASGLGGGGGEVWVGGGGLGEATDGGEGATRTVTESTTRPVCDRICAAKSPESTDADSSDAALSASARLANPDAGFAQDTQEEGGRPPCDTDGLYKERER